METLPILKEYILQQGSRHRSVRVLKKLLNESTFSSSKLPVDDTYDEQTRAVVAAFKRRHHLPFLSGYTDDVISETVWAALGQRFSRMRLRAETVSDDRLYSLLTAPPPFGFTGRKPTCDEQLAALFGGVGAVVSSRVEPPGLLNANGWLRYPRSPDGADRGDVGHSAAPRNDLLNPKAQISNRGGTIHIYANPQGLPGKTGLYVPAGFRQIHSLRVKGQVVKLGLGSNSQKYFVSDGLGITIVFAHVAISGVELGDKNAAGSTRIGNIGGPKGGEKDYVHTHIVFHSDYFGDPYTGTTVDPRRIFCK